jgi:hypothetical protein
MTPVIFTSTSFILELAPDINSLLAPLLLHAQIRKVRHHIQSYFIPRNDGCCALCFLGNSLQGDHKICNLINVLHSKGSRVPQNFLLQTTPTYNVQSQKRQKQYYSIACRWWGMVLELMDLLDFFNRTYWKKYIIFRGLLLSTQHDNYIYIL